MTFKVEEVSELRGFTVEYAEEGNFYLSRRNVLFHSETLKPPFRQVAVINAPFWKQFVSNSRLGQRLLRFQVTNVIPLKNGDLFVTFDKSIGLVRNGEYEELKGLVRPCRVLRSACGVDEKGNVFFGEYLSNNERGEIHVYKYEIGSDFLEIIYTFPPNSIRHVHGIYFDEFTKSLFCLTGDAPSECQILQTFDEFRTLNVIGKGDETWRAVSLIFTEKELFYGTDAEFRTNQIFKLNRQTNDRISLGEVSGTVFYSKKLGRDLFFTTTAENSPSQKENVAAIWHVSDEDGVQQVIKFQKDCWHPTLFQFGMIHFPAVNRLHSKLYFHLVGVKGDNKTFLLTLQNTRKKLYRQ